MTATAHVAVVVPAADEEDLIGDCLDALMHARDKLVVARPDVTVDITVVLDHCTDHTAAIVRRFAAVHTVDVIGRCVGLARDVGIRTALSNLARPPEHVWTAHTDADSTVPSHWLTAQLERADAGADVVLGTVEPDVDPAALAQWRAFHPGGEGHRHIHGANLGIRADRLLRIGGWPHAENDEDVLLVTAAQSAGLRIERAGDLTVTTSGRQTGRTPHGFADFIRDNQWRPIDLDQAETAG